MREVKTQLSPLLELAKQGDSVVIAGHGNPVAELIPSHKKKGLPIGIAREDPLAPPGDEWWQPMSAREIENWLRGK
jgi:antitoxin (DNA-binding transcriptional repressor) of toxin-antitoxin stability system